MKKKLIIYYGLLFTAIIIPIIFYILTFFSLLNVQKSPITEQDFRNKAAVLNAKVSNLGFVLHMDQKTVLPDEAGKYTDKFIIKSLHALSDNLALRYVKCTDKKISALILNNEYKKFINRNGINAENSYKGLRNYSSWNGKNFNLIQLKKDSVNYSFARIDDTYFGIISPDDATYEAAIQAFNMEINPFNSDFSRLTLMLSIMIFIIVFVILYYVPRAYIFKKASIYPLIAFVPFVSDYFLCKLADKEGWKMLLLYLPVVQIVYQIILSLKIAKVFNKSELFGVGIFFVPLILLPIIAFDNSEYTPQPSSEKPKNVYEEILKEEGIE